MPRANLGDAEIYYESHGSGEPLLLVSGLGGAASYWNPNLPAFSARYRTIVHDHRGAGQSTHSRIRYSVDQMTDDLLRLMDHLKVERAHLVGHSQVGKEAYVEGSALFLYPPWWIRQNEKLLEERAGLAIRNFPPVDAVASRIDAIVAFDRSAELGRIRTPTLVLCAQDDAITPAYFSEELAQKIPGAKLEILERGGHCASESVAEEFNRAVLDFLARHR